MGSRSVASSDARRTAQAGEAPGRGRPRVLTGEAIARAVLEVGFPELTFSAVSRYLGVGQTTLFRYVRDRNELVRLALELLIDEAVWPPLVGPWREVLEAYALASWELWASAPGSATEAVRGPMPLGSLRMMGGLCGLLMAQGFTARNALRACDLVFDLVGDSRRDIENRQRGGSGPTGEGVPPGVTGPAGVELADAADAIATTEQERAILEALDDALSCDPLDWFTSKLSVVLDGIQACLAPGA